jgi:hypothetical protein
MKKRRKLLGDIHSDLQGIILFRLLFKMTAEALGV